MENGHLSIEQIEDLSLRDEQRAGDSQEAWAHIGRCEECRRLIERYRLIHAKLQELSSRSRPARASMNCPDENIWFDVAGGLLSSEESLVYIQHASTCDTCSQKLRSATRIFADELSPAEEETLNSLPSTTPARQRELAESLGQASRIHQDKPGPAVNRASRPFWRWLFVYAGPAACLVAIFVTSNILYAKHQLRQVQEFADAEYAKGRPTDYRLAGLPYQRNRVERGSGDLKPFIEIPKSVSNKAPRLAAETAFLEDDPGFAKDILERARRSGDTSFMTLNDLAVATAIEGDRTRSQSDYEKALALLEEANKQRPDDATIYFNRALIFERLRRSEDARKSLEQFRRFERDTQWLAEAEKMLDVL